MVTVCISGEIAPLARITGETESIVSAGRLTFTHSSRLLLRREVKPNIGESMSTFSMAYSVSCMWCGVLFQIVFPCPPPQLSVVSEAERRRARCSTGSELHFPSLYFSDQISHFVKSIMQLLFRFIYAFMNGIHL